MGYESTPRQPFVGSMCRIAEAVPQRRGAHRLDKELFAYRTRMHRIFGGERRCRSSARLTSTVCE